jgi:hypothetical protein
MTPDGGPPSRYGRGVATRRKQACVEDLIRDVVAGEAGLGTHLDRAIAALKLSAAAERYARAEVIAARELDGASWADVGKALGVSRQTAHERFRTGPDGMHSRLFKRETAS